MGWWGGKRRRNTHKYTDIKYCWLGRERRERENHDHVVFQKKIKGGMMKGEGKRVTGRNRVSSVVVRLVSVSGFSRGRSVSACAQTGCAAGVCVV